MPTTDFLETLELTDEQRARVQDQGNVVQITLVEPITYKHSKLDGDRTLTELCLVKHVKGKHMKALDKAVGEISQSLALVAALAGVPANAMDELDARDLDLVMVILGPFLPQFRRTGTD
ncbi:phage tail assembly protein [Stutzerimonas nitrititolerans]|uniref:phage tail assembly protein n=1 Tax=Stutzerimonas nitrititolerans TaxID=2482751 RepID=UPI0028A5B458|nr:phage tail assembly protein [Stutzerimonas nitrititolerans]